MTRTIDLSNPTLATSGLLVGPWQVVLIHPVDHANWYIFNTVTRRYKKIGPVGAHRSNYLDQAVDEAWRRNLQAARGKWVIFSNAETQAQDDAEPMFWSNEQGWVSLPEATPFDNTDGDLPVPDGTWIQYFTALLCYRNEYFEGDR